MTFGRESDFEEALISQLYEKGWEKNLLKYKTEKELIRNWADILFENNRSIDRLNDYPLTDGEMEQILEQIIKLRTPLNLNGFINGKTVSIVRDNPQDAMHFGKEVSLKIYDRQEIAAGQSRYQIAQQPQFPTKSKILNDRRGDLMLLINGMPVIHIELKRSGIHVSQAYNQIEKYSHEGIFSGLFSLVQIFVAMSPTETVYFANPGPDGKFNKDYYFHCADFDNEPINDWQKVVSNLLYIPMAHELIGSYTVPDDKDGILKVLRSYQYFAASAISDKVAKTKWADKDIYGGYIWHTTGSGKTLTSFKSAQLIANSDDADKVVFLMDRIELGTQSLLEYRGFADDYDSVQATENTDVLVQKLKSDDHNETLIVTSIQKMSNIKEDVFNEYDIEKINEKRIVFIIDECHRSTFGNMLTTIKHTFPKAIFFGFTGTPIQKENQKKLNTTATVFGNELHRYSIADGIRDKNVLGFDPYMVLTYRDKDVRKAVALEKAKSKTEEEAISDPKKAEIYYYYMDKIKVPMAGYKNDTGVYIKGIEDYLNKAQYDREEHRNMVVKDIIEGWNTLSHNGKFHAIFATNSIPEAIQYYKSFKAKNINLNITALFDQNIDNNGKSKVKEEAIVEILKDYNNKYSQEFTMATFQKFKKDVSLRLAHKDFYKAVGNNPNEQLDILIVVDQMLTGYDSKWVNTLYLDKLLKYEGLIQAFSRTNRLFGPEKPFGTIKYYRKPHTMRRNIEKAFGMYSGDKPLGLFADKLKENLDNMNGLFDEIESLFENAGINNFEKLPENQDEKAKFAKLFKNFNEYLEAAKIQGFLWSKLVYSCKDKNNKKTKIKMLLDKNTYLILALRYKELFGDSIGSIEGVPYEIDGALIEIDTERIDSNYMNSRFTKYYKLLKSNESDNIIEDALNELFKTFATLNQEEQKFAKLFLNDIKRGDIEIDENKSLKDYIVLYQAKAKDDQIHEFAMHIGVDEKMLRQFMKLNIKETNINEFGRLDKLKESTNIETAKKYFEKLEGKPLPPFKIPMKLDNILRKFLIEDGFELENI